IGFDGLAHLGVDQFADSFADPIENQSEAESDNDQIGERHFEGGGPEQSRPTRPSGGAAKHHRRFHSARPISTKNSSPNFNRQDRRSLALQQVTDWSCP